MRNLKPLFIALTAMGIFATSAYAADGVPTADYHVKFADDIKKLLPENFYDNDVFATCRVPKNQLFTEITGVLTATKGKKTVAYITFSEPKGYKPITLYSVVNPEGKILGVRVLKQNEALGKGSQLTSTNWIEVFTNKDVNDAFKPSFALKVDGGTIDKFVGATVTPRAVVNELKADFIEFESKLIKNPSILDSWDKCKVNY